MLIGNVGKEPEVRYVDAGTAVARITLATSERGYTLPNGTRVPERTDWHTVMFWRRLAEVVDKYVHKGDKLYVEGRIRYTVYDDKRGVRHNVTEIWADNMEMLSSRPVPPPGAEQGGVSSAGSVHEDIEGDNSSINTETGNDMPF